MIKGSKHTKESRKKISLNHYKLTKEDKIKLKASLLEYWKTVDKSILSNKIAESHKGNNYVCLCCGYRWKSRKKGFYPFNCPMCHANNWDFGDNIKCYACNNIPFPISIHHIDGNHKNNSKENRIPLCSSCHAFVGRGANTKMRRGTGRGFRDYRYSPNILIFILNNLREKSGKGRIEIRHLGSRIKKLEVTNGRTE